MVEIESHWTATRPENQGIYPTVRRRDPAYEPRPSLCDRTVHPAGWTCSAEVRFYLDIRVRCGLFSFTTLELPIFLPLGSSLQSD
jgi:hypothetical protein